MWDPWVDKGTPQFTKGVYFIGTKHPEFVEFAYPEGSVVLDTLGPVTFRTGAMSPSCGLARTKRSGS